ncbi:MAG: hypothetical protein FWD19_00445 [Defluviitaleaceae bacterium]|nr:hypothetical protein [Defluviitaleaceae bacterium]
MEKKFCEKISADAAKNCSRAEIFIMQHFEKKIAPKNARRLAKHILICEKCRELFVTMDEAAEAVIFDAPENFTESVMRAVRTLHAKKTETHALRFVWGISALIIGIALFFFRDSNLLTNFFVNYFSPAMEKFSGVFDFSVFSVSFDGLGLSALILVAVMGILLYALHNEETANA